MLDGSILSGQKHTPKFFPTSNPLFLIILLIIIFYQKKKTLKSSYEEIEEIAEITTPKDNCSNTKNAIVTTREFLSQTKSFIQLKNYVIDVSLQQAFQQVNGSEIRNFDSLNMSDVNGDEDVNFNSSSSTKYAGLIDSYEIIDEEITDQFLILTVDANVCIKDK